MVSLPTIRNAKIVDLFPDREEIQARLLAHEPQADPCVSPSAADGLGNAPVVGCHPSRRPSVPEKLIEALTSLEG